MTDSSPVESYLNVMFDRLAGTGAAGRRLLADTESHLYDSTAAGRARGLSEMDAESEAVARFGPVDAIARRVPVPEGNVRLHSRRLLVGAWTVVGAVLFWYGLAGLLTWLISWPWVKLLIATERLGQWPMCGPNSANPDCLRYEHNRIAMVPAGGLRFPYAVVALAGAIILATLIMLRRVTRLGTPIWTPTRSSVSLALALPLSLAGTILTAYGLLDMVHGRFGRLSYIVAGTVALTAAIVILWLRGRRPPTEDLPD